MKRLIVFCLTILILSVIGVYAQAGNLTFFNIGENDTFNFSEFQDGMLTRYFKYNFRANSWDYYVTENYYDYSSLTCGPHSTNQNIISDLAYSWRKAVQDAPRNWPTYDEFFVYDTQKDFSNILNIMIDVYGSTGNQTHDYIKRQLIVAYDRYEKLTSDLVGFMNVYEYSIQNRGVAVIYTDFHGRILYVIMNNCDSFGAPEMELFGTVYETPDGARHNELFFDDNNNFMYYDGSFQMIIVFTNNVLEYSREIADFLNDQSY